jgi:hypothetical protein
MARISPKDWNGWHLETETPSLVYDGVPHLNYTIDLDRMLTRDQFAWWILQLHGKNWGDDALLGLVEAVDELLDPQTNAEFSPQAMRQRVAEFVKTGY